MRYDIPKERNVVDRGLPKGVYAIEGRYRASIWESGSKLVWQRMFDTAEEATYQRQLELHGHKWQGLPRDPLGNFGFIYLITNNKTGKMYVGKKQLYFWDGPVGGFKCTNPHDEWWDPKAWRESDWKEYVSSQKELAEEIKDGNPWDFTYEVLEVCQDKLQLHLAEIRHQTNRNVLEATDADGNYLYYNKNIASMIFRPPFKKEELLKARFETLEKMREYYLKPRTCEDCDRVIPYGEVTCGCEKDRTDT